MQLKLKVLEIYNHRLDERERRKNFILQQGLLVRNKDDSKRKWGREEKELHKKLDIFQRFSSKEAHDKFINELNTEMQLRKKIAALQNYRKLGIRTHAEIEQYEIDMKARQDELRSRHYRSTHGFGRRAGADEQVSSSPRAVKKTYARCRMFGNAPLVMLLLLVAYCCIFLTNTCPGLRLLSGLRVCHRRSHDSTPPVSLQFQKIELLSRNEAEMCKILKLSPAQYVAPLTYPPPRTTAP